MKKFLRFLTLIVGISLVFNFTAQVLQAQTSSGDEGKVEMRADGTIKVDGKEFKNLSEYFMSDYFKKSGKRCGTKPRFTKDQYLSYPMALQSDCTLSQTVIQTEYWPERTYTIPIVFHIIHKTDGTGNISDQRINDQVAVLNEDYRAITGSLGEFGYDTKIQFELAGITRTANDLWHQFAFLYEYDYKDGLGWDQNSYLNVYINTAGGYLGFSYFPQDEAGSVWDGVVVLYEVVGGRDLAGIFPYDQGRTLVHEIGHYLGLFHTFQDGCGEGYTAGDLIADTHSEEVEHYTCVLTYTCGTPDDIHNYMNYTDDTCMNEFTPEQGNRAVCGLLNYRPLLPKSLILNSPNGGESWDYGTTKSITWDSTNLTGNVKLVLYNSGTLLGTIAYDIPISTASHDWTIGPLPNGTPVPVGSGYVIRVKSMAEKSYFDDSNTSFTISEEKYLTLTCPNGGENWEYGTTESITWDSSGLGGNVKLVLYKDGTLLGTIEYNIPISPGSYDWTIGPLPNGTPVPAGSGYVIRVKSLADKSYYDDSDASFTITGTHLTLTLPNGGESWECGTTKTITWDSAGLTGNVKLVLFKDGTLLGTIANNIPISPGSYDWIVCTLPNGTPVPPGSGYVIRVKSLADKSYYDDSDASFTITAGKYLTLISPNGGEIWEYGSTKTIAWDSSGLTGNVKLVLFKDGTLLGTIANDIPISPASYDWTIGTLPNGAPVPAGSGYVIRVKSLADKSYYDDSDASFTII